MTNKEKIAKLYEILDEADVYRRAVGKIDFDMQTVAPEEGLDRAGEDEAFLSKKHFELTHSDEFSSLVCGLHDDPSGLSELENKVVDKLYDEWKKEKNLSEELVYKYTLASNKAFSKWLSAKKKNDFSIFRDSFEEVIKLTREMIEVRDEKSATVYDALLDDTEKGGSISQLDSFFESLKERIIPLVERIIKDGKPIREDFMSRKCPVALQSEFSRRLLKAEGLRSEALVLSESEHPFTTNFGIHDVRVTTHYYEDNFISNIFTTMHEGGHAPVSYTHLDVYKRQLYNWVVKNCGFEHKPRQIEFARLNLTHTVMSKRWLRSLVENGLVDGWDDPRMPTLCGLRRRGYTPEAIKEFLNRAGVAKTDSLIDYALLEYCIREQLNRTALRRIAVLDPVKVVIDNYPEDKTEYFEVPNHPGDAERGVRRIPFTKEIWIDRADFAAVPPPKFFRMKPEGEVRLMGAYIVKCTSFETDSDGNVTLIHCTADIESGNGNPTDGRKVKGTIHWVSADNCDDITVNLYDHLFTIENTGDIPEGKTFADYINPDSVKALTGVKAEKALEGSDDTHFQFVRTGYFVKDSKNPGVYNRIVTLKDSYKPE